MSRPMSKMLTYTSIFFAIVFGIYGAKKLIFMAFMSFYTPPPVTVSATKANSETWQSYVTTVSTLQAVNGVDLASESSGIIKQIRFNSGQLIKKGEPIILLDTSIETANLKSSRAKLQLAQMNYLREKRLREKNVSSQASFDASYADLMQAEGNVESIEAQISQKTIRAPFDGRLGIRQVNLGQFVPAGTNMVTLQATDSLYVMFNVPEQYLPNLYIDQAVDVSVNLGTDKTIRGKITAINSKVDPNTRNVLVEATIPNEKFILYPGMFGLVKIYLGKHTNTIVIPQTAVSYSLGGDYVFVIRKEVQKKKTIFKAYRQYVKVGERRDDEVSITDGLNRADLVVTSGQLKLQDGAPVDIDKKTEM